MGPADPVRHGAPHDRIAGMPEPRRGRPTVGMALYGDLTFDSRVRREARSLALAGCDVSIVCLDGEVRAPDLPSNVRVLVHRPTETSVLPGSSTPFLPAGSDPAHRFAHMAGWLRAYVGNLRSWGQSVPAVCGPVDAWHLHDLTALAGVLPALGRDVPVVYDAHELFLEAGTALRLPKPARILLRAYERRLVSRVSAVVTVNNALAEVLRRRYRPRMILVVHNCPDRWSVPDTKPALIREAAGIPGDQPVILHHGSLGPNRGIEQLMEALLRPGLENAHLVLLGFGEQRARYVEMAREPRWQHRIHVLDPVAPDELLAWIASADVGGMPIQRSTLNHYLSTPNKLFECLAAGVPVVASDFPSMKEIVDDPAGPLGVVCDPSSVDEVAAALRSILALDAAATESIRARCLAAAHGRWNWEHEAAGLTRLYDELVGGLS